MAEVSGKTGTVTVAAGEVTSIRDWALDYVFDPLETTDFQSSGKREYIVGLSGWTGSFNGFKNGVPNTNVGTEVALVLKETSTANQQWSGQAILTGISTSTAVDGVVTYNYTFTGTGALTVPTA